MNPDFDFDFVHEQAILLAGELTDFGADDYRQPLAMLLDDYDRHARLTPMGVQLMSGNTINDLAGRLHEEQGFAAFTGQLDKEISKPIFVVGMARTGTTVLLRLLGADLANQTVPLWLGNRPMRRPPEAEWGANPCFQQVQGGLDALAQLSSSFNDFHPQHASAADECRYVLNHTFRSPSLAVLADVPNYQAWVNDVDKRPVYERYRRVLNLIDDTERHWVLKCPSHLWSMPAILQAFPDACIVMTHRDPARSFPSLFDLVYQIRQYTEDGVTRESYGRSETRTWGWVLDRSERERADLDPARIFDIHADDLRRDAVGSCRRIYEYFGLPVSQDAEREWARMSTESPTGGHATHQYRADDFGLTEREIRDSTGAYYHRYRNVAGEVA